MKRLMHGLFVATIVAGGFAVQAARAHEHDKMKGHHDHESMSAMWKEKLDLSDDQVKKLKDAMKAKWDAEKPLRAQLHENTDKLGAQVTLKFVEADLKATLDQITKTRKALDAERDKFESNLASILTPTQRAKLIVSMERMHHEMWESHEHGGPPWMREHGHEEHGIKDSPKDKDEDSYDDEAEEPAE